MKFEEVAEKYQEDVHSVAIWCETEYQNNFAQYFNEMEQLYVRIQSSSNPITDEELEKILTDIPLQLFAASEALNGYKAGIEVVRLKIKQAKHEAEICSQASSQTAKRSEAAYQVLEDETLLKVYETVVDRVEKQISFSKELIMSAKKIWTSRRATDSLPTSSVDTDLPEYDKTKQAYIK